MVGGMFEVKMLQAVEREFAGRVEDREEEITKENGTTHVVLKKVVGEGRETGRTR